MSPLFGFLAITVAATFGSVFLWNRVLRRPPWIDVPRRDRHSSRTVPRTGGPAWLSGWLIGLGVVSIMSGNPSWDRPTLTAVLAVVGAFALGYVDDRGWVRSGWKGRLQAGLLGLFVFSGAWRPALTLEAALIFVLVMALLISLQIFDNIDGALGTVTACGLAVVGALPGDPNARTLAWFGAAASVGFLIQNRPPARVFFGNAGSQAVSMLAAGLVGRSLLSGHAGSGVVSGSVSSSGLGSGLSSGLQAWAVVLPFSWPLFDLLFVTVRRVVAGRAPWKGGRDHTTHVLARALGRDEAVFAILFATSILFAWLALRWGTGPGESTPASATFNAL